MQLLQIRLRPVRIPLGEAVQTELLKVGVPVGPALGELEQGQVVFAELKVQIAQFRDFCRVFNGLGVAGEEGGHLLL